MPQFVYGKLDSENSKFYKNEKKKKNAFKS